jgi:hypothetical protein
MHSRSRGGSGSGQYRIRASLEDAKNERVSLLVIMNEQLQKVEKSFKYFENTILEGMADQLAIYKAFRLFDPARIDALGQNTNEVEAQLASIPFFDANEVAALIGHLPAYRALAVGEAVDDNVDREAWWASKAHTAGVDRWYKGAAMVMVGCGGTRFLGAESADGCTAMWECEGRLSGSSIVLTIQWAAARGSVTTPVRP